MPTISEFEHKKRAALVVSLDSEFNDWRAHLQDLATYILPRRYIWLYRGRSVSTGTENSSGVSVATNSSAASKRNEKILDPTGTHAVRVLGAGMMNGITSPARPWFRLRLAGFKEEQTPVLVQRYLDEVTKRMMIVMAESNFYNAMAVSYVELAVFGTTAMLIYDDFDEVIRCYNSPMGEYRIGQDSRQVVNQFSRNIALSVRQVVEEFGFDNCSERVQNMWNKGGEHLSQRVDITHLIEPNDRNTPLIGKQFKFVELYWETGKQTGKMLRLAGYRERPMIVPRWEIVGNDTYGTSPAMDALPDIIQLQHETRRKGQSLDYMNRPPVAVDVALRAQPNAMLPGGVTYVPSSSQVGAKALYTVQPPIAEMTADIRDIQTRIGQMLHNDLFRIISQLDTVRSANEIDGLREEKLVQLGSVLERHKNEALDPAITRIHRSMERRNLLPPKPPGFEDLDIEIQYVSILADAQRAVGTGSIERFMQVVGELAAAVPEVLTIPDYDELIREYAERLNVPAVAIKPREQVQADRQREQERIAMQEAAVQGRDLTQAAKNLSETDVGGGQNAISALL